MGTRFSAGLSKPAGSEGEFSSSAHDGYDCYGDTSSSTGYFEPTEDDKHQMVSVGIVYLNGVIMDHRSEI